MCFYVSLGPFWAFILMLLRSIFTCFFFLFLFFFYVLLTRPTCFFFSISLFILDQIELTYRFNAVVSKQAKPRSKSRFD